ncbi:hypothetical protein EAH89_01980 [Roseomonas nepalensis]|uniref:Uncharacterized protein n=1 Tax=Muricoccus nepalensis TaxID=1854500 RepID=A0A502GIE8_9PROT|nr:hypothetical protein [Roseomonas nepalensis]TPG61342.1 hypothetical protein EAH89_01980 [Roseomonas nepalensis]
MNLPPTVSDAEIEAAATLLATTPDLGLSLPPAELQRIARIALAGAAQVRQPRLVRSDGAAFGIGTAFSTGRALWRCTDIGTRSVAAVRIDRVVTPRPLGEAQTWATDESAADPRKLSRWLNGPPYQLAEFLFDEGDLEAVRIVPREKVAVWDPTP